MSSEKGKTKEIVCTVCGSVFTGSLYANPKTAKCPQCKKVGKKVGTGNPVIHQVQPTMPVVESKPIEVKLKYNRSVVEGEVIMDTGEVIDRIPTSWKIITNKLDYLSVSKMQTYQQCPYRFHKQYMESDGSGADDGNIFTWFGSILHEVMDVVSKAFTDNGIKLNPLTVYDDAWRSRQLTDMGMYKEGRNLVIEWFKVHPIGTLPYKTLNTEYEWRGKISDLVGPVPDDIKDMDFGGQIDYVGEIDPNTAILKDYKSNRHPFTQYELEDSLQLQTYQLIAMRMYPQYKKWITGYEMFRFGWQQCPERTQDDLDAIKAFIINIAMQIVHDNTWDQRLNDFCGYCPHRHDCKKYCDFVNDPQRAIDTIRVDGTSLESINAAREVYTSMDKILTSRKDEVARLLKTAIEQATLKGEKLVVGDREMYLQAQSRPSYNYFSTRDVMAIAGKSSVLEGCLSVNKTKLERAIKDDPQLAMELSKCLEEGYSAPYLMSRKSKKK